MTYDKLMLLKKSAWQGFYDVFRKEGFSEDVIDTLRSHLNWDDCYNSVDDVLVEVFL